MLKENFFALPSDLQNTAFSGFKESYTTSIMPYKYSHITLSNLFFFLRNGSIAHFLMVPSIKTIQPQYYSHQRNKITVQKEPISNCGILS